LTFASSAPGRHRAARARESWLRRLVRLADGFAPAAPPANDGLPRRPLPIYPAGSPSEAFNPVSGAVRVGNTLYLSGSLGLEGGQRPATAEAEARNVLNAVQRNLEAAGMTMDDLVYVQIFASDVSDYGAFNEVYRTFFTQEYPARAFIGSGTLLFGARFEVQGIAVKR
jgi:enamine deaminase RidA (YjgF/YER057c/UK114 family)